MDSRDVAANLFLGREPTRWKFFVDRKKMIADAQRVVAELRVNMPSMTVDVGQLSGGQRQTLAIGRATAQQGRIILKVAPEKVNTAG